MASFDVLRWDCLSVARASMFEIHLIFRSGENGPAIAVAHPLLVVMPASEAAVVRPGHDWLADVETVPADLDCVGRVEAPFGVSGCVDVPLRVGGCLYIDMTATIRTSEQHATDQARLTRPLLVNVVQAAEMLSLSRSSIYQLIWSDQLTPIRIGRSVRFSVEHLEAFVEERLANC